MEEFTLANGELIGMEGGRLQREQHERKIHFYRDLAR